MTPRWGVVPVRNDHPLGGNDTPSEGCKKNSRASREFFSYIPPKSFYTPRLQIPGNNPGPRAGPGRHNVPAIQCNTANHGNEMRTDSRQSLFCACKWAVTVYPIPY